jgi:alpha-amylase
MKKVNFLFGVHCHQPVGNFEHVIEENYQKAYLPFMEVMSRYPGIKFAFHFSGILYDYFLEKHADFIEKLKELVKRGQAEVLTGGYYEPVLCTIPEKDALGQIEVSSNFIKQKLGYVPRGLWLTERIWEPSLPKVLSQAGIEYVTVDDSHFVSAGFSEEDTFGYYVSEDDGKTVNIFPISKKMRYLVPFKLPEETIHYLGAVATERGDRAVVLADDGEKFGGWPGTHQWVHKEGYLERLLNMLEENAGWIRTLTFSEYLENYPPLGRVYLPTASYFEMMEWSLPARAGKDFARLLRELEHTPYKERALEFLKGGFFRNFFAKYPESNNMHKKMLYVSQKLASLAKKKGLFGKEGEHDPLIKKATLELYQGQCNCAYWHGVFGGLYLDFLRKAVYRHLIAAENLLDQYTKSGDKFIDITTTDFDKDGQEEILVSSNLLNLYLSPHEGAAVFEIDYRPRKLDLINTLSRREETYHQKILQGAFGQGGGEVASIHDRVVFKEQGLDKLLSYDKNRRVCFIDHVLDGATSLEDFYTSDYQESGNFACEPYRVSPKKKDKEIEITCVRDGFVNAGGRQVSVQVQKQFTLYAGQSMINVSYQVTNLSEERVDFVFAPEINLSFLSGGDKSFYLLLDGERYNQEDIMEVEDLSKIAIVDKSTKLSVSLQSDLAYNLWFFKVFTVSQSEGGFEKNFQGIAVVPRWKLDLLPGGKWNNRLVFRIEE